MVGMCGFYRQYIFIGIYRHVRIHLTWPHYTVLLACITLNDSFILIIFIKFNDRMYFLTYF